MQTPIPARRAAAQVRLWAGIILFAALTALTARITINLPFTPVPITLQVLAVLLAGLVLGSKAGAASQIAYLGAMAAGLPISARGLGGLAPFAGPTGGYLIAFALGAFVTGWLAERWGRQRFAAQLAASLLGVLVIYLGGTAWLGVWMGNSDVTRLWQLGVAPFIAVDLGKAIVAAAVARSGRALLHPSVP